MFTYPSMSLKIVRLSATNEAVVHHVLINLPLKQIKEHVIFRCIKNCFLPSNLSKMSTHAFYIPSTNMKILKYFLS